MNDKNQPSSCRCSPGGRNLVVCIDGTSNQFGAKNTNVVELYSQLVKSEEQLTYYNSGIGTYAKPSWRSFKHLRQVIENKIDLAIAINFERIVLGAYRWLVENYRENDRIFLFGFSRGAYQVRALAGMIEKVGLIFKGNEEQIPFAYEIYADASGDDDVATEPITTTPQATSQSPEGDKPINRLPKWLGMFARTSQRKGTLKSPAIAIPEPLRSQSPYEMYADGEDGATEEPITTTPQANSPDDDQPINRPEWLRIFASEPRRKLSLKSPPMRIPKPLRSHTLSNAEDMDSSKNWAAHFKTTFSRKNVQIHFIGVWDTVSSVGVVRGKSLPLTYSADHVCFFRHALALDERRVKFLPEYVHGTKPAPSKQFLATQTSSPDDSIDSIQVEGDTQTGPQRIKEVWFAGTHSDIGGGNRPNLNRNLRNFPFLWMSYEAASNGLRLEESRVDWKWDDIGVVRESLTGGWRLFEWIPFKRLTYKDATSTTFRLHMGRGRKILPGQKIHASVALCPKDYEPKAKLAFENRFDWSKIIGRASITDISWVNDSHLKKYLELDIFDYSIAKDITSHLKGSQTSTVEIDPRVLFRLLVMVLSSEGCNALTAADSIKSLRMSLVRARSKSKRNETKKKLGSVIRSLYLWEKNYHPEARRELEQKLFCTPRPTLFQRQSAPNLRQIECREPRRKISTPNLACQEVGGVQKADVLNCHSLMRLTRQLLRLFPGDTCSLTPMLRRIAVHQLGHVPQSSILISTCLGLDYQLLDRSAQSQTDVYLFVNYTDMLTGLVKYNSVDADSVSAREIRISQPALNLILERGRLVESARRFLGVDVEVRNPRLEYPGYQVFGPDGAYGLRWDSFLLRKTAEIATSDRTAMPGGTLVFAVGDGTFGRIKAHVVEILTYLLKLGWRVELFTWGNDSLCKFWEDEFGGTDLPWAGRFILTKLDQFAAELVDIPETKQTGHDVTCDTEEVSNPANMAGLGQEPTGGETNSTVYDALCQSIAETQKILVAFAKADIGKRAPVRAAKASPPLEHISTYRTLRQSTEERTKTISDVEKLLQGTTELAARSQSTYSAMYRDLFQSIEEVRRELHAFRNIDELGGRTVALRSF